MSSPLAKLIPTALLVATLAYLAWSHYDVDEAPPPPSGKLPEISADLLQPTPPPQTERDPFGKSVKFELGETSDERPVPGRKGAKPADKTATIPPRPGTAPRPGTPGSTGGPAVAAAPRLSPAEAKAATEKALTEMVLNATLLYGDRCAAVINGRVYRLGDPISTADSSVQLRLAEIHHHRVVLEHDGKMMNLAYSDKSPDAKPARGGQVAGKKTNTKTVKTSAKTRQRAAPPPARPPDAPPR